MCKTYNGWTNYDTWCVALWLDNDSSTTHYIATLAASLFETAQADGTFSREQRAALDLAHRLKDEIEEMDPLADQPSLYSDLLTAALSAVNYYEIAQNVMIGLGLKEAGHENHR